jgi:hypothetical protein
MPQAIWNNEHVDFLASLDHQNLTDQEISVLMSKQFKMRVTASHVSRLLGKMRLHNHEFFRDIPYRATGRR